MAWPDTTIWIWGNYIDLIWKMSLNSEWLFSIFCLIGSIFISIAPFRIAVAIVGESDAARRWKLALFSPTIFLIIPTLSLDWYYLTGKRYLLKPEWIPQAHAFGSIAFYALIIGGIWGVLHIVVSIKKDARLAKQRQQAAIASQEEAERRELLRVKSDLERQLREGN